MQKCLIILGMHRSGTSAVAGYVNHMGIPLGSRLLPSNSFNEKGHFENTFLVDSNEQILQTLGSSWDDPFDLAEQWWDLPQIQSYHDTARQILLQEFCSYDLFCLKDPRLSVLLPFWIGVLRELKIEPFFLIPLRHPLEVAASLTRRNGFSMQKGLQLWTKYALSLEQHSRSFRRMFFRFEDFLKNPDGVTLSAFDRLQIPRPGGEKNAEVLAEDFIDSTLRHHDSQNIFRHDELPPFMLKLYAVLTDFCQTASSDSGEVWAEIDQIRGHYERLISVFYNRDFRNEFLAKYTDSSVQGQHFTRILTDRDSQIVLLKQTVQNLLEQTAHRDSLLSDRERLISAIYGSTSWQITRPMRAVGQPLKNLLQQCLHRRDSAGQMHAEGAKASKIPQGPDGKEVRIADSYREYPLISVIMPLYNACRSDKKYLLNALKSIANQTYENIEVILIDDGSSDDSLEVCRDFMSSGSHLTVRYLTKKNGGQSSARNYGVKCCKGDYITFIDQDDEWYQDKLERIVPWLQDKSIDVLYTDADTIDACGVVIHEKIHRNLLAGWPHPKQTAEDILFKDIFVMPGLMTIKKTVFEKIGGFDENLSGYEDDDLFLRLFFAKSHIFYLPAATLRWRMYDENYSFSYRMLASRSYYWKKLLKNYTDDGNNKIRVQMISLRFFREFVCQALFQYDAGNDLYRKNIEGASEIIPYLAKPQRYLIHLAFMLPLEYKLKILAFTRKTLHLFR